MKKNILFSCFCIAISCFGCTQRILDFTIISSKNIDLSEMSNFVKTERVRGEDYEQIFVIISTGEASLKEAIDNAIEKIPGGVALVDGVIYNKELYFPFIYAIKSIIVEGTVVVNVNRTDATTYQRYGNE